MRCIIPDVKKKSTFIFGLTLKDILIAMVGLIIEVLVLASSFVTALKLVLTVVIITLTALSVMKFDVQRGYELLIGFFNFITRKRKFNSLDLKKELNMQISNSIVVSGVHTAVIELNGIDFSVLSVYGQNEKINQFTEILKEVKNGKIIKLDKPLEFEPHIQENEEYITDYQADLAHLEMLAEQGTAGLDEEIRVLRLKKEALDNQNQRLIYLEDVENINSHAFYLLVQETNEIALEDLVDFCMSSLSDIGLMPRRLKDNEQTHELSGFLQRFYHNEVKFEEDDTIVLPSVKEKANKIILDGKTYRVMAVHKYSAFVDNAWAWKLLRIPETKVVINFRRYSGKIDKLFDKQMLEIRTALADPKIRESVKSKLEGDQIILSNLMTDIQFGSDRMLDLEFYILYPAEIHKKVLKEFSSSGLTMNDLYLSQYEGYLSMYPYLTMNQKKVPTIVPVPASSTSAMFPFVIKRLDDKDGSYLGGSGGLPVFFNLFHRDSKRMNSNVVVLGKPGGGKSYFMKDLLFNNGIRGKRIFILDPENEYRYLCKQLNGNYIDVSGARKGIINPLQVFPAFRADDDDSGESLAEVSQHKQFLEEFFKTIAPELESYSLNVLLDIIKELYGKFGIHDGINLDEMKPEDYPTFSDLSNLLNEKLQDMEKRSVTEFEIRNIRSLQMIINKFVDGGLYSILWNGPTTMDISNNFTVMNFQTLFSNNNRVIANAQMLLIVKYLNQEVIKNRENASNNIIIALDEAHRFIDPKFPVALRFMKDMAKQIRKYYGSLIVTTQNIDDFIGVSPEVKQEATGVINSCQYSFIFSLLADDINKIKDMYSNYNGGLQEEEIQYIANGRRGDCLFFVDVNTRLPLHITAFANEDQYFLNPDQRAS